jgi:hypothetical protein
VLRDPCNACIDWRTCPSTPASSLENWERGEQIANTEPTVRAFLAHDEEGARAAAANVDAARAAGHKLGLLAVPPLFWVTGRLPRGRDVSGSVRMSSAVECRKEDRVGLLWSQREHTRA